MKHLLYIFIPTMVLYACTKDNEATEPICTTTVGENYVVIEAEATESPLGYWEIITEEDSRYRDEDMVEPAFPK